MYKEVLLIKRRLYFILYALLPSVGQPPSVEAPASLLGRPPSVRWKTSLNHLASKLKKPAI